MAFQILKNLSVNFRVRTQTVKLGHNSGFNTYQATFYVTFKGK